MSEADMIIENLKKSGKKVEEFYMGNKGSDENVENIEDDIKLVKRYLENSAYKETDSDFFKNGGWEMVDLEIPKAMANILAEREQKDKRIKELEEESRKKSIELICYQEELENSIPTQVVIDKIEELKTKRRKLGFKTYLRREDMLNEDKMIVCKIEVLQELLEGAEK